MMEQEQQETEEMVGKYEEKLKQCQVGTGEGLKQCQVDTRAQTVPGRHKGSNSAR